MKQETKDYLTKNGKKIAQHANEGCICAQRIIDLYSLYYKRPEHIALALLELSIDRYKRYKGAEDESRNKQV